MPETKFFKKVKKNNLKTKNYNFSNQIFLNYLLSLAVSSCHLSAVQHFYHRRRVIIFLTVEILVIPAALFWAKIRTSCLRQISKQKYQVSLAINSATGSSLSNLIFYRYFVSQTNLMSQVKGCSACVFLFCFMFCFL